MAAGELLATSRNGHSAAYSSAQTTYRHRSTASGGGEGSELLEDQLLTPSSSRLMRKFIVSKVSSDFEFPLSSVEEGGDQLEAILPAPLSWG